MILWLKQETVLRFVVLVYILVCCISYPNNYSRGVHDYCLNHDSTDCTENTVKQNQAATKLVYL